MADTPNPLRYGECWPAERVAAGLAALEVLRDLVTISGGWAWHFLSPPGHSEYKHAHDHKDLDVFVAPRQVPALSERLAALGFARVRTRHDAASADFRRYACHTNGLRVVLDGFVRADVPCRALDGGWRVVEPAYLLTLYGVIHSSDRCWAVLAAQRLLAAGIDPAGRSELLQPPDGAVLRVQ